MSGARARLDRLADWHRFGWHALSASEGRDLGQSHVLSFAQGGPPRHYRSLQSALVLMTALALSSCQGSAPYEGKSVADLQRMLHNPDPNVQTQGAFGLSRLGSAAAPAVPDLIDALRSPQAIVRQNAALALGQIGPEAHTAVDALKALLSDPEWTVRRQAALALGNIGPQAASAVEALETLEGDPKEVVRKAGREALAKIRP